MSYDVARPYTAAFVIFRRQGKIAFVLRENTGWMNGYYGLASGKVEKNESYLNAAIREAKEEVDIDLTADNLKYAHTMHRKSSADQTWVDVYFEAVDWKGEPYNAEPHVHKELKWVDIKQLPENVIPPVRHALDQIAKGYQYSEYGWKE